MIGNERVRTGERNDESRCIHTCNGTIQPHIKQVKSGEEKSKANPALVQGANGRLVPPTGHLVKWTWSIVQVFSLYSNSKQDDV